VVGPATKRKEVRGDKERRRRGHGGRGPSSCLLEEAGVERRAGGFEIEEAGVERLRN
jgi:hypothetical protein